MDASCQRRALSGGIAGAFVHAAANAAGILREHGAQSFDAIHLRGPAALFEVCARKIHPEPLHVSADGNYSWEEVECLGACVNAPMVLIWNDTYEDLTAASFEKVLDGFVNGKPVKPGPQIDRQLSAPVGGPTTLKSVKA